ncbi:hypothetical protein FNB79_11835 [Formosa sediminum]|uniref:Uncharacterized protein n=1 Tax=Formosa sediminum TaxID=2594004 RepID=A0A516GSX0_9FLAO|nr:hypothetical protein [Formosa sediminum]QDO94621.1 hypothetical protein FNB79_11835 [Formosa sediminum]
MKKLSFISILLIFLGCSPKISEHFEQNKYIKNYSIHIINDSLQLYFKTPADITYTTNKKKLKKIIRNEKFKLLDSVLVYGKTNDPPYEYFVTISKNSPQHYPKELVVFDTIINNQIIRFIGNSLSQNSKRTLEIDLNNIFKSLELGSTYRKQISTVFDIVKKYQPSNKFYAALNEISEFPTYDKQEEWSKLQMELTFSSFLGKNEFYETYLNKLESRFKPNDTISEIIRENSVFNSQVIDTIIKEAEKHKIVMINENHFYPNHRILVSDLLKNLKEIGYNYLALEALNNKQDTILNLANSYPALETGFYTSEQNYSNLIRKAKELRFKFIAYENTDNSKNREIGQAENLYNKTFLINQNSKVVVLAGVDHILEKPTSKGKEWMATVFKNKYNIDPLTISQTHLNSYRKQIKSKYGIINSNNFDDERLNSIDYLVLNNNNEIQMKNMTTSYQYKNKTENDIQITLFFGNEIANRYDYTKKVPYFTTIIKSGKKTELPIDEKQEIYLYTFDKNGKRIDKQIITPTNNSYK